MAARVTARTTRLYEPKIKEVIASLTKNSPCWDMIGVPLVVIRATVDADATVTREHFLTGSLPLA
jgi:hypothetical protein